MVEGGDRRLAIRVVYETMAMAAEYDGEHFPLFSAFWEVKTTDLSPTGIGFISSQRPRSPQLLLMLGNPQATPIFLVARVAHCQPVDPDDDSQGCHIGCELIRRLTR
jgi:hypothetical protein